MGGHHAVVGVDVHRRSVVTGDAGHIRPGRGQEQGGAVVSLGAHEIGLGPVLDRRGAGLSDGAVDPGGRARAHDRLVLLGGHVLTSERVAQGATVGAVRDHPGRLVAEAWPVGRGSESHLRGGEGGLLRLGGGGEDEGEDEGREHGIESLWLSPLMDLRGYISDYSLISEQYIVA